MIGHFIKICKFCGSVISQCRCADLNKTKMYGVCAKCASEGKKDYMDKYNHDYKLWEDLHGRQEP